MSKDNQLQWWGYRHTNGNIQVKRYFEPLDIQEAISSPFCSLVHGPFPAEGRADAIEQVTKALKPGGD